MKTFHIKTFGCKVNQYESQVIRENFLKCGFIESSDEDSSDIEIINTCTVTSTSDTKSLKAVRRAVREGRLVAVTGCMVEDKNLDLKRLKGAEFIIANRDKYRIPYIISQQKSDGNLISHITALKDHTRVFLKVQDGCNNFCSYCKVRLVRGPSRSRPLKDILDEFNILVNGGAKEIVLTGICLGSYGRDISQDLNLACLIKHLCAIDGNWRLRLSSIEPKDITPELIQLLATERHLCKHLHIPFQSGDDYILKKMNRPYTSRDYLKIIARIRGVIPDIAISTDIMVGFPYETERRFKNTVSFLEELRPMRMHIFPFSRRKGTLAYNYSSHIQDNAKKKREGLLFLMSKKFSSEFVNRFLGRECEVLVENTRSRDGYLEGYNDRYIKVYISGPDTLKGNFIICRLVLGADGNRVEAIPVDQ